jgi:hypothetical protein
MALSLLSLPAFCENDDPLPDAPVANARTQPYWVHTNWFGVIDPDVQTKPLSTSEKMWFWLREQSNPATQLPVFLNAGYAQLAGGDPKYGSDSEAFGKRVGAIFIRSESMRFFGDSLLPTLTHEDPRYYRKAYGSFGSRALYTIKHVVITRRDDGTDTFNYSEVGGILAGAALTQAYYPQASIRTSVVFRTWGYSVLGQVGTRAFLEFWPDVDAWVFHRHRKN